jgi:hypothetical protein
MIFGAILLLVARIVTAQSISDEPSSSDCDGAISLPSLFTLHSLTNKQTNSGTYYSQENINDAATAALSYYASGETVGSDEYPHQYKDYEGFSFLCSAPYL